MKRDKKRGKGKKKRGNKKPNSSLRQLQNEMIINNMLNRNFGTFGAGAGGFNQMYLLNQNLQQLGRELKSEIQNQKSDLEKEKQEREKLKPEIDIIKDTVNSTLENQLQLLTNDSYSYQDEDESAPSEPLIQEISSSRIEEIAERDFGTQTDPVKRGPYKKAPKRSTAEILEEFKALTRSGKQYNKK